ncbi:hypothetical protein KB879_06175 [Cupriavidus sp. KK10]|jgi:hypothetical protein|uniref:hypothetical protein n=1 Tax=Cupriavidus sp. KK10 TaxID=1478019 RepID=UPI001BA7AC0F|nr:hypothetical protein [Cupriavidus sp. KK10]QUN29531.1 hypothetical protein KB879_06175 [Cupriavidus sp. KK10]
MDGKAFEIARQALAALELYRGQYASSELFQAEKMRIAELVRDAGRNGAGHPAFLTALAAAIETI